MNEPFIPWWFMVLSSILTAVSIIFILWSEEKQNHINEYKQQCPYYINWVCSTSYYEEDNNGCVQYKTSDYEWKFCWEYEIIINK